MAFQQPNNQGPLPIDLENLRLPELPEVNENVFLNLENDRRLQAEQDGHRAYDIMMLRLRQFMRLAPLLLQLPREALFQRGQNFNQEVQDMTEIMGEGIGTATILIQNRQLPPQINEQRFANDVFRFALRLHEPQIGDNLANGQNPELARLIQMNNQLKVDELLRMVQGPQENIVPPARREIQQYVVLEQIGNAPRMGNTRKLNHFGFLRIFDEIASRPEKSMFRKKLSVFNTPPTSVMVHQEFDIIELHNLHHVHPIAVIQIGYAPMNLATGKIDINRVVRVGDPRLISLSGEGFQGLIAGMRRANRPNAYRLAPVDIPIDIEELEQEVPNQAPENLNNEENGEIAGEEANQVPVMQNPEENQDNEEVEEQEPNVAQEENLNDEENGEIAEEEPNQVPVIQNPEENEDNEEVEGQEANIVQEENLENQENRGNGDNEGMEQAPLPNEMPEDNLEEEEIEEEQPFTEEPYYDPPLWPDPEPLPQRGKPLDYGKWCSLSCERELEKIPSERVRCSLCCIVPDDSSRSPSTSKPRPKRSFTSSRSKIKSKNKRIKLSRASARRSQRARRSCFSTAIGASLNSILNKRTRPIKIAKKKASRSTKKSCASTSTRENELPPVFARRSQRLAWISSSSTSRKRPIQEATSKASRSTKKFCVRTSTPENESPPVLSQSSESPRCSSSPILTSRDTPIKTFKCADSRSNDKSFTTVLTCETQSENVHSNSLSTTKIQSSSEKEVCPLQRSTSAKLTCETESSPVLAQSSQRLGCSSSSTVINASSNLRLSSRTFPFQWPKGTPLPTRSKSCVPALTYETEPKNVSSNSSSIAKVQSWLEKELRPFQKATIRTSRSRSCTPEDLDPKPIFFKATRYFTDQDTYEDRCLWIKLEQSYRARDQNVPFLDRSKYSLTLEENERIYFLFSKIDELRELSQLSSSTEKSSSSTENEKSTTSDIVTSDSPGEQRRDTSSTDSEQAADLPPRVNQKSTSPSGEKRTPSAELEIKNAMNHDHTYAKPAPEPSQHAARASSKQNLNSAIPAFIASNYFTDEDTPEERRILKKRQRHNLAERQNKPDDILKDLALTPEEQQTAEFVINRKFQIGRFSESTESALSSHDSRNKRRRIVTSDV